MLKRSLYVMCKAVGGVLFAFGLPIGFPVFMGGVPITLRSVLPALLSAVGLAMFLFGGWKMRQAQPEGPDGAPPKDSRWTGRVC